MKLPMSLLLLPLMFEVLHQHLLARECVVALVRIQASREE